MPAGFGKAGVGFLVQWVQGVEESDEKTRLPDGRPAEFANRDASDYSGFGETVLPEDDRVVVPPYEWPYETLVLKRVLGER